MDHACDCRTHQRNFSFLSNAEVMADPRDWVEGGGGAKAPDASLTADRCGIHADSARATTGIGPIWGRLSPLVHELEGACEHDVERPCRPHRVAGIGSIPDPITQQERIVREPAVII